MGKFFGEGFNKEDFMNFKFFITPQIIKALWILSSVLWTIGIIGYAFNSKGFFGGLLLSVILVPIALLFVRLFFEAFMVLFAAVSLLREIRDNKHE